MAARRVRLCNHTSAAACASSPGLVPAALRRLIDSARAPTDCERGRFWADARREPGYCGTARGGRGDQHNADGARRGNAGGHRSGAGDSLRWGWAATWFWSMASRCCRRRRFPRWSIRATGAFRTSLARFLERLFAGRIRSQEIEAEAAAQIALLQSSGLKLTHIDTHKHTHMFPAVLRPVLRAARSAGIRAVRNPFEPDVGCARHGRRSVGACAPRCSCCADCKRPAGALLLKRDSSTTDGTIASGRRRAF